MGYKARTVRLDFKDLVDEGEECWVEMLNPKLCPVEKLTPDDLDVDETGQPKDFKSAEKATNAMIAGLITGWVVYDALDASENPPPLPLPATAELVAKLPVEIITAIGDKIGEAFPNS